MRRTCPILEVLKTCWEALLIIVIIVVVVVILCVCVGGGGWDFFFFSFWEKFFLCTGILAWSPAGFKT